MKQPGRGDPWFPDLCRLPRLAAMLGLAQLTIVVVALVPDGLRRWDTGAFLSASGYALWLALAVTVLLCVSRQWLSAMPVRLGSLVAVLLATLVAMLVAAILHMLFASVGGMDDWPALGRFVSGSGAVVALLVSLALRYFYVIDRWQAQIQAHARAEADALQARIRPHFLFNSMNMIASLLRRDAALAERAVLDLSDLFRAALGAGGGDSTLADEVDLAERYLAIEQLRLGERLHVAWDRREPLPWQLALPRLILQPLLENAVLHGISRLPRGGTIGISLAVAGDRLALRVVNPSPPPSEESVHGAGHALRNIVHRLGYMFGPEARMTAGWQDGEYVCEIVLPVTPRGRPGLAQPAS